MYSNWHKLKNYKEYYMGHGISPVTLWHRNGLNGYVELIISVRLDLVMLVKKKAQLNYSAVVSGLE